jgi:ankyrin repeat protein
MSFLFNKRNKKIQSASLILTKLFDAIYNNDIAQVSSLIPVLISNNLLNGNGGVDCPLSRSAQYGRVEIMTMLIDAGANVNFSMNGYSLCYFAVCFEQLDALKLLIARGAKLDDHSLLAVAREHQSDEIVNYLLDAGAPLDQLAPSQLMGLVSSVAVFRRLMARRVDLIAMRDSAGNSLCHHVAHNVRRHDELRFLVRACGDDAVNAVDNNGATPMHYVMMNGNASALKVLVELGADIDRQDNNGWTALHHAAKGWHRDGPCVELLLALGADVNLVTNDGQAASHLALQSDDCANAIAALLAKGVAPHSIAIALPTVKEIDAARRRISLIRLSFVRHRAFQICLGLQPLNLDALQLCEIMMHSFGAIGSLIGFHHWWTIATTVKHHRKKKKRIKVKVKIRR